MSKALIVIDFINEIVNPEGKLAGKGYADFIESQDTYTHLNRAIEAFRSSNSPIVFVALGFKPSYENQPKNSPVFGKAHDFGILEEGTWSTAISDKVDFRSGEDTLLVKSRVSAFHETGLAETLRERGVTDVYIAGVATDLAVESAARSAHDNDFNVFVVADASAAANQEDHNKSLAFLPKIAQLVDSADL